MSIEVYVIKPSQSLNTINPLQANNLAHGKIKPTSAYSLRWMGSSVTKMGDFSFIWATF